MTIRLFIATVFFLLLIISFASAQSLEFELQTDRVESEKPILDERIVNTEAGNFNNASFIGHVILTPTRLFVGGGGADRIYDFENDRRIDINPATKTYVSSSIYAWPFFKFREIRNRIALIQGAHEAGFTKYPFSLFELEMMFGGATPSPIADAIEHTEEQGRHTFSHNGDGRTELTFSTQAIPGPLLDMYRRYLIHEQQVHPVVIDEIVETGLLFNSLTYQFSVEQPNLADLSFELISHASEGVTDPTIPQGYTERFAHNERLHKVIEQARSTAPKTREQYRDTLISFLNARSYLEAFLAFREYLIHYGTARGTVMAPAVDRLLEVAPQSPADLEIARLEEAIRIEPTAGEKILQAIATLEDAKKSVTWGHHVLDVFLANLHSYLPDQQNYQTENIKAANLILGALEVNPHMTGAFKDLGDKYYSMYQMFDAWAAWDEMKRINIDHPLVSSVLDLETKIRQGQPEAFLN